MNNSETQNPRFVENRQTKLLKRLGIFPTRPDYDGKMHWRDAAIVTPLFWSWVFLSLAIFFASLSFFLDALSLENWTFFQRSGAVLVAAGSYVQFKMPNYDNWSHETVLKASADTTPSYDRFLKWSFRFHRLSWYAIIAGTFIWAYGDWVVD
jgi:hypothetical protein